MAERREMGTTQWVWLGHRMGVGAGQGRKGLECGGEVMGCPWGLTPGTDQVLWREGLPGAPDPGQDLWAGGAPSYRFS